MSSALSTKRPIQVTRGMATLEIHSTNALIRMDDQAKVYIPPTSPTRVPIMNRFRENIARTQREFYARRQDSDTSSLSSISSADYAEVQERISARRAQQATHLHDPTGEFETKQAVKPNTPEPTMSLDEAVSRPSKKRIRDISDGESDYLPGDEDWTEKTLKKKKKKKGRIDHSGGRKEKPIHHSTTIPTPTPGTIELQDGSCQRSKYRHLSRCMACVAKKTGEPCRFRGIRAFAIDNDGKPSGPPVFSGMSLPAHAQSLPTGLIYPTKWFVQPSVEQVNRIKSSVAQILLPILQTEKQKLAGKESITIHRMREMDVRVTCDRCLTSIFSASFICTKCGRDFCIDCYDVLEAYGRASPNAEQPSLNLRYQTCGPSNKPHFHTSEDFLPVSRLGIAGIGRHIREMEGVLTALSSHRTFSINNPPSDITEHLVMSKETPLAQTSSLELKTGGTQPATILSSEASLNAGPQTLHFQRSFLGQESGPQQTPSDAAGVQSLPIPYFHHSLLGDDEFQRLWSAGSTIVVSNLLEKLKIEWTPDYFIQHHGSETCWVTDCENETRHPSNVRDFFSQFGNYSTREGRILKLKDWPPSADFRTAFPALFEDFHSIVPAPNYTRRDGFFNIAAHFPTNIVAPDMGPKMYNAFASDEEKFGSTRLHMDMADAVNIMLYSSPRDGEEAGFAVWDIYPSENANEIRAFLQEEFPPEKCSISYIDPIHSQYFYLTPQLRKRLYERHGVRAWRIYQRPGDAVFIPAGCAHQVCNLADCIKVAVDFVSPENLDRCSRLTSEFRHENAKLAWKDDILQLSNMCWSAWEHTNRLEGASTRP